MKTLDLSGNFVACDLKVGGPWPKVIKSKTKYLQKPLDQSKPNFICSIYGKTLKIFVFGTGGPISMKLGM